MSTHALVQLLACSHFTMISHSFLSALSLTSWCGPATPPQSEDHAKLHHPWHLWCSPQAVSRAATLPKTRVCAHYLLPHACHLWPSPRHCWHAATPPQMGGAHCIL